MIWLKNLFSLNSLLVYSKYSASYWKVAHLFRLILAHHKSFF